MDLKQKYTEVDLYEIDDWFFAQLQRFDFSFAMVIIGQIVDVIEELPKLDGFTQRIFGVIKSKEPLFFEIEYLNQEEEIPILVDIERVGVDNYLDAILDNKTINQIENGIRKTKENRTED